MRVGSGKPDGPPILEPQPASVMQAFEDARAGQYTLSIREAKYFLRDRLGWDARTMSVRMEQRQMGAGEDAADEKWQSEESATRQDLGPAQRFAQIASGNLQRWLDQEVHILRSDADASSSSPCPRTLVRPPEPGTPLYDEMLRAGCDQADLPALLLEKSKAPHALVWICPDPFLRLVLHCVSSAPAKARARDREIEGRRERVCGRLVHVEKTRSSAGPVDFLG